jgi:PAS domain S-box-containing protein
LSSHERAKGSDQGDSPIPPPLEHRGAEESVADARFLIDHIPCGFAVLDLRGKILFANPAFLGMVGQTESSLRQLYFQDLLLRGGKLFYETQLAPTLLLRGSVTEIAFDLVNSGGTHVPVLINASLHAGPAPESQQIFLAVFGAQQRRLYEKELLRARKEFEQIAEVVRRSSDAILRLTADGIVQSWNAGASQIFGFTSEKAIGKTLSSLFEVEDGDAVASAMEKLKVGQEAFIEVGSLARSGNRRDLSVSMTPHMEAPGILIAFSAIVRDVTSRKQAERALLQNEKLASVGRLASSIAHEINNPLESVTNLLYILQSRVVGEETRSLVTTAQKELARVSHIATHTLRFHKQSSSRTAIDLSTLAGSVLALYQVRLENSGISVTNDSADASPFFCFEGELRQILFNLVANAFDAMRGGGRLVLRCRDVTLQTSGRKGVRITIADTGLGMDKETLRRTFEPFFSTKGIGGTGLGLWITEELVRKNGGSIRIRSSICANRSGTVVTMLFQHQLLP